MKITKQELVDLIKEELDTLLNEVGGAPISDFSKWQGIEDLETRIAAGESTEELLQDYPSVMAHPGGKGRINIAGEQSVYDPGSSMQRDIARGAEEATGLEQPYPGREVVPGMQARSYPTSAHRRMAQALDAEALRQQPRRREEQPLVRTVTSAKGRKT